MTLFGCWVRGYTLQLQTHLMDFDHMLVLFYWDMISILLYLYWIILIKDCVLNSGCLLFASKISSIFRPSSILGRSISNALRNLPQLHLFLYLYPFPLIQLCKGQYCGANLPYYSQFFSDNEGGETASLSYHPPYFSLWTQPNCHFIWTSKFRVRVI